MLPALRVRRARPVPAERAKPYKALAPIEFITHYFARPVPLTLRLFGDIFAGSIMISAIGLLPPWILWAPNAGWKMFDLSRGLIQVVIFTLLTIISLFALNLGSGCRAPGRHAERG